MIALVVATSWEAKALRRWAEAEARLPRREGAPLSLLMGSFHQAPYVLALTGTRPDLMASGVQALLRYVQPTALVFLGFASGLGPQLRSGDLLLCTTVAVDGGPAALTPSPELQDRAQEALQAAGVACQRGGLLTRPQAVTAREKPALLAGGAALAVDTEGYWQAQAAVPSQIPFLIVRCILDASRQSLPPFSTRLARRGRKATLVALATLLLRPWQAASLPVLARLSRRAQRRLAQGAVTLVAGGLTPGSPMQEPRPSSVVPEEGKEA